ncbi:MAG: hypothetical protein RIT81_14035 [Deltaproteobacteria bacterium]
MSLTVLAALLVSSAPPPIFDDPRDPWTLLDRRLINRELFTQIRAPGQHFRFGNDLDWLALAADASVGTQQTGGINPQSRYHGYFLFDGFLAVQPLDFVDVNVEVLVANPSASDGFRLSSQISAGVSVHLHYDEWVIDGVPLDIDGIGVDLGPVTLGQGLLLERIPLEGQILSLGYDGFYFRHLFGGRVFWSDDDLITFALGAFDGRLELNFARWQFTTTDVNPAAHYLTASFNWPLTEWAGVSAEYGARLRNTLETAGMIRFDASFGDIWGAGFHVGYQARYYGRGFSPRTTAEVPTLVFSTPERENTYVTNSYEFFDFGPLFDQWAHTLMGEVRIPVVDYLYVTGTTEILLRSLDNPRGVDRVTYVQGHRAPGQWVEVYYRFGLEVRPWPELPHRINAFITNKQVASDQFLTDPVRRRFEPGDYVVVEAEVFL